MGETSHQRRDMKEEVRCAHTSRCFPDMQDLAPKFVEGFVGPRVTAMRELMASRRVQTADGSGDLVNAFNEELKALARRNEVGCASLCRGRSSTTRHVA
jgi:hypothetical protein